MLNILRKNKIIVLLSLIIIFFGFYLFFQNIINDEAGMGLKSIPARACVKEKCFDVEIANTSQEREMGLMNRDYLASGAGMLFIFEKEGNYNFWMKNTLIPLDIIWIGGNYKIIYIEKNAQPCNVEQCKSLGPNKKVKYVLEINGGLAEEMEIKIEDKVWFK